MDFSVIGQRIRELRKSLKLSQEELAEGICTQAQISKIEKGDVYPYANTLYLISQKLGVDVNYFFEIGSTPRIDYVNEVTRQLRLARRSSNFDEIQRIVKIEENNPLFTQNGPNLQLILWHKGIYEHALNRNAEEAIKILEAALKVTHTNDKVWSERELEVLIAIGSIYSLENKFEQALTIYLKTKEYLEQLLFISDYTIMPRLYYNISRVYGLTDEYSESIRFSEMAIRICIEKDTLFPLGELHYHLGYIYEKIGKLEKAYSYVEKAIIIFELIGENKYLNDIIKGKEKLKADIESQKKETDHAL